MKELIKFLNKYKRDNNLSNKKLQKILIDYACELNNNIYDYNKPYYNPEILELFNEIETVVLNFIKDHEDILDKLKEYSRSQLENSKLKPTIDFHFGFDDILNVLKGNKTGDIYCGFTTGTKDLMVL